MYLNIRYRGYDALLSWLVVVYMYLHILNSFGAWELFFWLLLTFSDLKIFLYLFLEVLFYFKNVPGAMISRGFFVLFFINIFPCATTSLIALLLCILFSLLMEASLIF